MVKYEPKIWNSNNDVKHSHNCYSYFLNKMDPGGIKKCSSKNDCKTAQPGYYRGLSKRTYNNTRKKRTRNGFRYKCSNVLPRIQMDNPGIQFNGKTRKKCPAGFYEGALATTAPTQWKHTDFHFYRKDENIPGWSHKTGKQDVSTIDAKGSKIFDPYYAARTYAQNDYSSFCGYFCIPEDGTVKNMSSVNLK